LACYHFEMTTSLPFVDRLIAADNEDDRIRALSALLDGEDDALVKGMLYRVLAGRPSVGSMADVHAFVAGWEGDAKPEVMADRLYRHARMQ
jgi:hypothetical protein